MTPRRLAALAAFGSVCLIAHQPSLFACSCHDGGLVCEAFWKSPVVFAGRVANVTRLARTNIQGPSQRIRFHVTEAFRGTAAAEIDLFNYATSCNLGFRAGEDWLIYAFPRHDGPGLTTFTCSRTRRLSEAAEDLTYARAIYSSKAEKGRIFGLLAYPGATALTPVPGVAITLGGGWIDPLTTTTDRDGRYEILAPSGNYQLTAALPKSMSPSPVTQPVELLDARGCAVADFIVRYPGQIAGRVLSAGGSPVPNVTVELLNAARYDYAYSRIRGVTDASGRFVMANIEPGRYLTAVATAYGEWDARHSGIDTRYTFPGGVESAADARPVQVDGGSRRDGITLTLPKAVRVAQVSGVAVLEDGRPAAHVKVRTKADFDDWDLAWTTLTTDAQGRFTFGLIAGSRYRLVAETLEPFGSPGRLTASAKIDPAASTSPLRLVLR